MKSKMTFLFTLIFCVLFFNSCKKDDEFIEETTEPEIEQIDSDGDGIIDEWDNCPNIAFAGQEDDDYDGIGNVCDEDYAATITGVILESEAELAHIEYAIFPYCTDIPEEYIIEYIPEGKRQGFKASGPSFAASYALKTFQEREEIATAEGHAFGLDVSDIEFSPAYTHNQLQGECEILDIIEGECGTKVTDILDVLKTEGVCYWDSMPYEQYDNTPPNTAQIQEASNFKIADYRRIDFTDLEMLKTLVVNDLPIIVTIALDENFTIDTNSQWANVFNAPTWNFYGENNIGYQTMLLYGFNDEYQSFKLLNSWGIDIYFDIAPNIGERWITYDMLMSHTQAAYIAFDEIKPEHFKEEKYLYGDWDGDNIGNVAIQYDDEVRIDLNYKHNREAQKDFDFGANQEYLCGDWDKDGIDEFAVRSGNVITKDFYGDETAWLTVTFGSETDEFFVGDWDGDGDDDIGVRLGTLFSLNTNADEAVEIDFYYGQVNDKVIIGDFNGDGTDNIGLVRDKQIIIDFDLDGVPEITYDFGIGNEADEYFSDDWNGDGIDDIGYRQYHQMFVDTNFDGLTDITFYHKIW